MGGFSLDLDLAIEIRNYLSDTGLLRADFYVQRLRMKFWRYQGYQSK